MSDGRSIWLVTAGSYSDFRILEAFADEADADAVLAAGYGEDAQEFRLRPSGWLPVKRVMWTAYASVAKTAPYDENLRVTSVVGWQLDDEPVHFSWEPPGPFDQLCTREVAIKNHANRNKVELRCSSFDQERAVKTVSDAAAKLKAEREGL